MRVPRVSDILRMLGSQAHAGPSMSRTFCACSGAGPTWVSSRPDVLRMLGSQAHAGPAGRATGGGGDWGGAGLPPDAAFPQR